MYRHFIRAYPQNERQYSTVNQPFTKCKRLNNFDWKGFYARRRKGSQAAPYLSRNNSVEFGIKEKWYYSITDVIAILTDSTNPRVYWANLKTRAKSEGFDEALVQIEALKLKSSDSRFRFTDTANRQTLLRIIQSIPSPKAEPFRLWLAQVGEERFEEIENPEAA